jgi:phospholipid N-methyltransferase
LLTKAFPIGNSHHSGYDPCSAANRLSNSTNGVLTNNIMLIRIYRNLKKNITEDGLIISSSGFLVNSMVGKIDFSRPLRILEIGSGKGAFTRELIGRMSPDSRLDICEIKSEYNPWIEQLIRENSGKNVTLHNCCVTQLLVEAERYDVILSSLPLKNFEDPGSQNEFLYRVIKAMKHGLKEGGVYLQYQYFKSNKSDIESVFGKKMDDVSFVPLNILPAFVYRMSKSAS